jgi:uncharacterized protein with PIN domain
MCHPLVSWLRIFDYDTIGALEIGPSITDSELIEKGLDGRRILVTRDRELSERAFKKGVTVVLIEGNRVLEHLRQVVDFTGVDPTPKSNRCTVCNGRLTIAGKRDITDEIAMRVANEGREIWLCLDCGQHYWKGSQWASIERTSREIMGG